MHPQDNGTLSSYFSYAVDMVKQFLKVKIFSNPGDEFALLFYGTVRQGCVRVGSRTTVGRRFVLRGIQRSSVLNEGGEDQGEGRQHRVGDGQLPWLSNWHQIQPQVFSSKAFRFNPSFNPCLSRCHACLFRPRPAMRATWRMCTPTCHWT